ncbi:MAG: TolC family protein [Verrucomicrobia bacterium]|nr:TolC family protein [Verrucomicrobiota bacterium]
MIGNFPAHIGLNHSFAPAPLHGGQRGGSKTTIGAAALGLLALFGTVGCSVLHVCEPGQPAQPSSEAPVPANYPSGGGAKNSASLSWEEFFADPVLTGLIRASLDNNQELNILLQEIAAAKAEVIGRKGAYLPFVTLGGGAGLEKPGRFTRDGAVEENLPIKPGKEFPEPLSELGLGAGFSWEVDIWRKLRNERDAAILRFLATKEGRGFMVTKLVSEMAETYYELLALDNQLAFIKQTIQIQQDALKAVQQQKAAAKATELAVRRFEAEVLKNQSHLYAIQQDIVVKENHLNFLAGRYPQPIERNPALFVSKQFQAINAGTPVELLSKRPDIIQAELELAAAGLDVKSARARFYPSLDVMGALGLESYRAASILTTPESVAYRAAADVVGPLINRSAIKAAYKGATASQVASIYNYQQTVLAAYVEVLNELSQIQNYTASFELKSKQVQALTDSVGIAGQLFNSARADYTEVLFTQRDALESRMDLVELKQQQLSAYVKAYRALGGGYERSSVTGLEDLHVKTPVLAKQSKGN